VHFKRDSSIKSTNATLTGDGVIILTDSEVAMLMQQKYEAKRMETIAWVAFSLLLLAVLSGFGYKFWQATKGKAGKPAKSSDSVSEYSAPSRPMPVYNSRRETYDSFV